MAEETTETKETKETPEKKAPEAPNEIESLAEKLGWNPDYDGGEREFVSAEDYILRSREIQDTTAKQLKAQRRETTELKQGLEALQKHNETVYKVQVANLKKEVRALKKERVEAEEDGDTSRVREINQEIADIDKIPDSAPIPETQSNPVFEAWLEKNEWYLTDKEMQKYADTQGASTDLAGLPEQKLYETVTKRVKKHFSERFPKPQKPTPKTPGVESTTPAARKPRAPKFTRKDLSEMQKRDMDFFVAREIKTEEEYINELAKIGALS